MTAGVWLLSLCVIAIEAWGSVYLLDAFLGGKDKGRSKRYRYAGMFCGCAAIAYLGGCLGMVSIKVLLAVLFSMLYCSLSYRAGWKQCIFFACLNYCLLFLTDLLALEVENISGSKEGPDAFQLTYLLLPAKIAWACLLLICYRKWKGMDGSVGLSDREWLKFGLIPLFTLAAMMLMFFCHSADKRVQGVYLFLSAGLIMLNVLVLGLMRDIVDKGGLLRKSALAAQKAESQLAQYRDMQAVFERQGRKLHDYKNQLRTIQMLLKNGDAQAASALAERLTKSISVEMSAVNTNHPVVNAVLDQKFHAAREQGIAMVFKVGDMSRMRLDEEETVILLSNLLDNAIRECAKVVKSGKSAVIHIKLVQEDGRTIFSVRNPVAEKVQITDGIVLDQNGGMHGIGLSNVKAVADRYGGDLAVSCDNDKFQAVVML